ncbi:MAG: hypothetical protein Q7S53_00475 [bacterium]|nr:hypothetical protein [bacterium]
MEKAENNNQKAESEKIGKSAEENSPKVLFQTDIRSNIVPKRGIWWHVIFTLIFVVVNGVVIYFNDWALLFFIVVAAGYSLWRGHEGHQMTLVIDADGVMVNTRKFKFDAIESYYFGLFGDNVTFNFFLMKKYVPRLTYLLLDEGDADKIRKVMQEKVPETEPMDERITDFIVRKLKM